MNFSRSRLNCGLLTYVRSKVQFLKVQILALDMAFIPLAGFVSGWSFLSISFYLNEFLKRSLGAAKLISLSFDAGSVILVFGDFEPIVSFIGSDDPFGRFIFGVSFDYFIVAVFDVIQVLQFRLFGEGSQLLEGVPLRFFLHVTNYLQLN